jgi:hypothetical protein
LENISTMVTRINAIDTSRLYNAFLNKPLAYGRADIQEQTSISFLDFSDNVMVVNHTGNKEVDALAIQNAKRARSIALHKRQKSRRKVLKKSAGFLMRLIGSKDTTAFVRGDEIEVVGQSYVFSLRKNNLMAQDHGAFQISVIDRETGLRLVDLCWYIPSTPALDQLAALVLAVRVGDEEDIIKIGNHLRITQHAREHETFAAKLPARRGTNEIGAMFPDPDTLMHYTPGTTDYINNTPQAYIDFINIANSMTILNTVPPQLETRYRMPRADEIRRITQTSVGGLLRREEDDEVLPEVVENFTQNFTDTARDAFLANRRPIGPVMEHGLNAMFAD